MNRLLVNDVPIWGKFRVLEILTKKVLHDFDGEGHGDLPPDIAVMQVIAMYASDDVLIMEV